MNRRTGIRERRYRTPQGTTNPAVIVLSILGGIAFCAVVYFVVIAKKADREIGKAIAEVLDADPSTRGPLLSPEEMDRRARAHALARFKEMLPSNPAVRDPTDPDSKELAAKILEMSRIQFRSAEIAKKAGRRLGLSEDEIAEGFATMWIGDMPNFLGMTEDAIGQVLLEHRAKNAVQKNSDKAAERVMKEIR